MFVGLGLSGILPVIHGLQMYSMKELDQQMAFSWVMLQGALYILGAGLYAVSYIDVTRVEPRLVLIF